MITDIEDYFTLGCGRCERFATPDCSTRPWAACLLAMCGAALWLGPGARVPIPHDPRLGSLCLVTAPLGFFQAPEALTQVRVPLQVWAGGQDTITVASQAQWLAQTLPASVSVDLRLVADAGHFSFMDSPPPHAVETVTDKAGFLREFAGEVCGFVMQPRGPGIG